MLAKILVIPILNLLFGFNFYLSPANLVQNLVEDKNIVERLKGLDQVPYLFPATEATHFPLRDWSVSSPSLGARSALIYDSASEKVLFSKEPEAKLPIASLTKLMTAVAVIESINLDDVVVVSESAIEKSKKEGGGSDLYEGEKIKAHDLLKLMLIESSNDAAYALEEHLAANYGIDLIEKMNTRAFLLGMKDTRFSEPAGLDDKNGFSTGQDLIKLVEYSLKYNFLFDILKTPRAEVVSIDGNLRHSILNTNQLLGNLLNIIGGKTGFTELSGGSMILVTKSPSGSELITILLGSDDRFGEVQTLVKWAERAYIWQ